MPVNIIKTYAGQNIIKVRRAGGREYYGYRMTVDGKEYLRAEWNTKAEAEDARDALRQKLRDPDYDLAAAAPITLEELESAWAARAGMLNQHAKRITDMRACMKRYRQIAASQVLTDQTEEDLLAYQNSRVRAGKHNHTVNRELAMIRTCMLAASSLFPGLQWVPPKIDKSRRLATLYAGREVLIGPEEHARIVATLIADSAITGQNAKRKLRSESAISAENERRAFTYDAYMLASELALRISELAGMKKSDVNLQRGIGSPYGIVRVTSAKTKKRESVPLTPGAAGILKRRIKEWPGEYVFRAEGQSPRQAILKIRRGFKSACERAGLRYGLKAEGIVFHTTRHTLTTRIVNDGHALSTVGQITRHSKRTMVLRYSHATAESMAAAINSMSIKDDSANGAGSNSVPGSQQA